MKIEKGLTIFGKVECGNLSSNNVRAGNQRTNSRKLTLMDPLENSTGASDLLLNASNGATIAYISCSKK